MHGIAACRSLPGNPDTPSMAVSACEKNVIPRTYMDQIENGDSMPAKSVDKFFQHDSFGFMGTARRPSPYIIHFAARGRAYQFPKTKRWISWFSMMTKKPRNSAMPAMDI